MRTKLVLFSVLLISIFLSGCAMVGPPKLTAEDAPLVENKELNFSHTPVQSLGFLETENLRNKKTCTGAGRLADKALSEFYPGRTSWKGWSANLETGREFFGQVALSGMYEEDGSYSLYYNLDDCSMEGKKSHGVMLSSDLSWVADLTGNVYLMSSHSWQTSKEYRLAIIRRYGTPLRNLKKVEGFEEAVLSWNLYDIKGVGDFRLPYGDEEIRKINSINPGYSLMEKIALKGQLMLYPLDPVATTSNVILNIIYASGVKSEAWDYSSNLPSREVMGVIFEFTGKDRKELIKKIHQRDKKIARR